MQEWLQYFKFSTLGSSAAFQKTFHNFTDDQLVHVRAKFEALHDSYALPHEFAAMMGLSWLLHQRLRDRLQVRQEYFVSLISGLLEEDLEANEGLQTKLKQMLAVYYQIDSVCRERVTWETFSLALQSSSWSRGRGHLTWYQTRQQYQNLVQDKCTDPLYSVNFLDDTGQFAYCGRDGQIYLVNQRNSIMGTLSGHKSLPLSCVSLRPPCSEFLQQSLPRNVGGINLLSSGADRRLIVWTPQGKVISQLATEHVVSILCSVPQIVYKDCLLQPAVFAGDDLGNFSLLRFDSLVVQPHDASQGRSQALLGELDCQSLRPDTFVDFPDDMEPETPEKPDQSAATTPRVEAGKKRQELLQRSTAHAQTTQVSSTPVWQTRAHSGYITACLAERMADSGLLLLCTGGVDGMIRQYDPSDGSVTCTYAGHTGPVSGLCWLQQRGLMVSVGKDRRLFLWVVQTPGIMQQQAQKPLAELPQNEQPYVGCFSSPNKLEFGAVDTSGSMKLYDVRTLEISQIVMGNTAKNGKASTCAYDPQTGAIAIATQVAGLVVPEGESQQAQIASEAVQKVTCSPLSPGFVAGVGGGVQMWDILRGKCVSELGELFKPHPTQIGTQTGLLDNGELLGGRQGSSGKFDSDRTGQVVLDLTKGNTGEPRPDRLPAGGVRGEAEITALSLSPNGQLLCAATGDKGLRVYSTRDGSTFCTLYEDGSKQRQDSKGAQNTKNIKDRIEHQTIAKAGPCRWCFLASSQQHGLCLWAVYSKALLIYSIQARGRFELCGQAQFKHRITAACFATATNNIFLAQDGELLALNQDGGIFARLSFGIAASSQQQAKIKFCISAEENIILVGCDTAELFALDTRSLLCAATWKLPCLHSARAVAFSAQHSTLLVMDDSGLMQTFQLNGLQENMESLSASLARHPAQDLSLGLFVRQEPYECAFSARRAWISCLELPRDRWHFLEEAQKLDAVFPRDVQQTFTPVGPLRSFPVEELATFDTVPSCSIAELCLTDVCYSAPANLFMASSALGHVLAIDTKTGRFIEFFNQAGWDTKARKEITKVIQDSNMGRHPQELAARAIKNQREANSLIRLVLRRILQEAGVLPPQVYHEHRDTIIALALARQTQLELQEQNAKYVFTSKETAQTDPLTKQIRQTKSQITQLQYQTEKMQQRLNETLATPSPKKLPHISRQAASSVLSRALAAGSALSYVSPTRTPIQKFQVKTLTERDAVNNALQRTQAKASPLPVQNSILTMDTATMQKHYEQTDYKPSSVTKEPQRIIWDIQ